MLENPGDITRNVNPYIGAAVDYAASNSTTSLAKAQVYATLALAWEMEHQRRY